MPAPVGTNPRGSCTDQGAASCGDNGACDGAGRLPEVRDRHDLQGGELRHGPRRHARLALHGDGSARRRCSRRARRTSATPARSASRSARATATARTASSASAASCGKKALGTACADGTECDSRFCAQGVCCAVACAGGCLSCALQGSEGACTPVTAGAKPPDAGSLREDGRLDVRPRRHVRRRGRVPQLPARGRRAARRPARRRRCGPRARATARRHCQIPAAVDLRRLHLRARRRRAGRSARPTPTARRPACAATGRAAACSAQYFRQTNLTDLAFSRTDAAHQLQLGRRLAELAAQRRQLLRALARQDHGALHRARTRSTRRPTTASASSSAGNPLINHFIRHSTVPEDTATICHDGGQARRHRPRVLRERRRRERHAVVEQHGRAQGRRPHERARAAVTRRRP